ncbi:MAG TPA: hypothetical protein VF638_00795 [Sphingomonas sp.]|jgi:hypothetical protein
MNVSDLMEAMAAAGAPMEAIVLAVRALEAKDASLQASEKAAADKRAAHAEWKRNRRAEINASMDSPRTEDGQSALAPFPAPPNENNLTPPTHTPVRQSRSHVREPKFSLPSDIPEEEWDGFEEMRKRIGKPMTDRARTLAISELRKLADAGHPPGEVLNHCTMNSYQGIFPPKDQKHGRQNSRRSDAISPSLSAAERFASYGDLPAH